MGRHTDAMDFYLKSLSCHDGCGLLYRDMGRCHVRQGDYEEAITCYLKAQAFFDDAGEAQTLEYTTLLRDLGMCRGNQGLPSKAMELFEKAKVNMEDLGATNSIEYALLLQSIGVCHGNQDHNDEAMEF